MIGSGGLIGSRFLEISDQRRNLHAPKQIELDITNTTELKATLSSYDFSAVVNFAAFTDVAKAEEQRGDQTGDCWKINEEGVRNLAEAIRNFKEKINFIQISTDMVFPGSKNDPGPYLENHPLDHSEADLTWYGYCKAEGEKEVRKILGEYATILRIIYPVRSFFGEKKDYLRNALSLFDEGKLYPLFNNQQISVTFIDEACALIDKIIKTNQRGTFHASSRDTTSPYQLVSYLIYKTGKDGKINEIQLDDFIKENNIPIFRYPKYGGLSVNLTEHKLGFRFSSWREIVDKLIAQGLANKEQ